MRQGIALASHKAVTGVATDANKFGYARSCAGTLSATNTWGIRKKQRQKETHGQRTCVMKRRACFAQSRRRRDGTKCPHIQLYPRCPRGARYPQNIPSIAQKKHARTPAKMNVAPHQPIITAPNSRTKQRAYFPEISSPQASPHIAQPRFPTPAVSESRFPQVLRTLSGRTCVLNRAQPFPFPKRRILICVKRRISPNKTPEEALNFLGRVLLFSCD